MPFMPTRRELLSSTTLAMIASLLGGARPAGAADAGTITMLESAVAQGGAVE
jgi:hypothetical protein